MRGVYPDVAPFQDGDVVDFTQEAKARRTRTNDYGDGRIVHHCFKMAVAGRVEWIVEFKVGPNDYARNYDRREPRVPPAA
jgi:hypothetical protein